MKNCFLILCLLSATTQQVLAQKYRLPNFNDSLLLETTADTTANVSFGDLDGDGEYEIVLHQTGRGRDNPSNGFTDPPIFQAYKLDGTLMWTINLGKNIREGAHASTSLLEADPFSAIVFAARLTAAWTR